MGSLGSLVGLTFSRIHLQNLIRVLPLFLYPMLMVLFNLPLGDEPDYGYRVAQAANILGSSYYRLDAAGDVCRYSVGVFDFGFSGVPAHCKPSIDYISLKILTGFGLFFLTYAGFSLLGFQVDHRVMYLSFCLPGVWSAILAAGLESFAIAISLFLVMQRVSYKFFLPIILIFMFDFGSGFIFSSFLLFRMIVFRFFRTVSFGFFILIIMALFLTSGLADFVVIALLKVLPGNIHDVYLYIKELDSYEKYETYQRVIMVPLMAGGWFPSHLKLVLPVLFSFILFLFVSSVALLRSFRGWSSCSNGTVEIICSLIFIVLIVNFFPNYSNFKYYVFLVPLFMRYSLSLFGGNFFLTFIAAISLGAGFSVI
ncbi:hypothetical protein OAD21_02225 [Amylibacter sp.]|nr:hypothetical protein [Amylibacter sp.]